MKHIFLDGGQVRDQTHHDHRCAVIAYVRGKFVFSARRWSNQSSSYICQLQQQKGLYELISTIAIKSVNVQKTQEAFGNVPIQKVTTYCILHFQKLEHFS